MKRRRQEERVTDRDLRRLRRLPVMIYHARQERDRLRDKLESMKEHDTVQASDTGRPYGRRTVEVGGWPDTEAARVARLEAAEAARELEGLEGERRRLERFISQIEDRELRRLFVLHYRQGKSWQRCALELGYTSEAWARRKAKDYLAGR